MLLALLSLSAHAETVYALPVTFLKSYGTEQLSLADGHELMVDCSASACDAIDAWPVGTPLQYAYHDEAGPVIIEPVSGHRLTIIRRLQDTRHVLELMEAACLETAVATNDMVSCTLSATRLWEKEVERGFAHLESHGDPGQRETVATARAAWHSYMQAHSTMSQAYYAQVEGTIVRMLASSNHQDRVREQAEQLWSLAYELHSLGDRPFGG